MESTRIRHLRPGSECCSQAKPTQKRGANIKARACKHKESGSSVWALCKCDTRSASGARVALSLRICIAAMRHLGRDNPAPGCGTRSTFGCQLCMWSRDGGQYISTVKYVRECFAPEAPERVMYLHNRTLIKFIVYDAHRWRIVGAAAAPRRAGI